MNTTEQPEMTERKKIIQRIFEYRDIVLLVLLVISGFTWMYNVFATQKQLKSLTCVIEQTAFLEISKLKRDLKSEAQLATQGKLSILLERKKNGVAVDLDEIEALVSMAKNLQEDLDEIDEEREESIKRIKKQECDND